MFDKEPNDEISRHREEYTRLAYRIASKKYEAQKRAERKTRRKNKLKSWGIIIGILAGLATIAGFIYNILCFGR